MRALLWGREVGVSIYRWGSKKLSVFDFFAQKPVEPVFPRSNFGQDRLKKVVLHTFTKD